MALMLVLVVWSGGITWYEFRMNPLQGTAGGGGPVGNGSGPRFSRPVFSWPSFTCLRPSSSPHLRSLAHVRIVRRLVFGATILVAFPYWSTIYFSGWRIAAA